MSRNISPDKRPQRTATLPTKLTLAPTARMGLALAASISLPKSPDGTSAEVTAPVYARMQGVIQKMLHSEHGVPIRSHTRRLISAIPSAFTGADIVTWLMKNLYIRTKVEAVHIGNLLSRHGFFFCVEGTDVPVKDDGTLFRFQTPYYWPSQNPSDSDFDYGVYLVKQVLRSKHRIRLYDYEMNNLHKLKLRLAKDWRGIANKAEMDVKIFREQKRVAKAIISSQEEAFWRLHRPPPGSSSVSDSTLSRHYLTRPEWRAYRWNLESLRAEVAFLRTAAMKPKVHMSTVLEGMVGYCKKYKEFDPMLEAPLPSNPWITGDTTLWSMETSLLDTPTDRHVRNWACSFHALLSDVTGRQVFEEFCKSQYNHENVRFWQSCQDLKSIPLKAIPGSIRLIYDEFLQRNAGSEVNVSAKVQEEVERDLETPSRYAFTAAQEQIYQLMQNDIYSRFLKSSLYQDMLKRGKDAAAGKGFFARLQLRKNKLDVGQKDARGISPNLPQRYTKRQLSISRKLSSNNGSSSLDDLFLASSSSDPTVIGQGQRRSVYTEAFIDALTTPGPNKTHFQQQGIRRVSAPGPPTGTGGEHLEIQESIPEVERFGPLAMDSSTIPMSYSADDMKELLYDADNLGPSKWKKFGIAAGMDLSEPLSPIKPESSLQAQLAVGVHPARSLSTDHTHGLLAVPTAYGFSTSPKTGAFEYESINKTSLRAGSSDSIHSTASQ
ncbi:regulator of G-protein signaling 7-like [Halichondria panicea]|uniref:regulator of G-protein signaling 7-like n=1 Tax=Halichondria panicea TaxID=6063 RepID=UPI00312B7BD0